MNATIVRRAEWVIATLALIYACFAFLQWRTTELIIAIGIIAICAVADIGLRHEQRAQRGPSPFGPVNRGGLK